MNNLSKEKKQQLLLVAFVTVIVVGIIWVGLISTQRQRLETAQKKTEELRTKVENALKLNKQAGAIQEELQETEGELRLREETMASGDLYQWGLSRFNEIIKPTNLKNFNSGAPTLVETRLLPKFPYRSASYGVRVNGHYHELGKFIADLENAFPYARVQNIDLTPAPGQSDERLNLAFDFVTVYHTNRAVSVR